MTRLAAIYTRISSDDAGVQTATGRQERLCRAWVAERSWEVAGVFEDVGRSAWADNVHRPAYEELLREVAGRRVDVVVVWRLDRLVRSPGQFERFLDACLAAGVEVASVTEPVSTSDPVSVAILRVLVTFAGLESDVKSIRIRARQRELAEQGRPPPGPRAYGYSKGYTAVVPEEAARILEAKDRVLDGESTATICRDWNQQGIPGARGLAWTPTVLSTVLSSPSLAGDRTYHGEVVAEGCWPPILDRLTSAEVRNVLAGQRGHATRMPDGHGLLRGSVRCGICGGTMYTQHASGAGCNYTCARPRGCGGVGITMGDLDEWITQLVLFRLESRRSTTGRLLWDRTDTNARIIILNQESRQLRELNRRYFVTADVSYSEWVRARDDLTNATGQRLVRDAALRRPRGVPPSIRTWEIRNVWAELSLTARRAVIALELAWVTIGAGTKGRWTPERIAPEWLLPDPPPTSRPSPVSRPARWGRPDPCDQPAADQLRHQGGPYDKHQAARLCGVWATTVDATRRAGTLPSVRTHRGHVYTLEDLDHAFPPDADTSFSLTANEARQRMSISNYRLRQLMRNGELPFRQRSPSGPRWFAENDIRALQPPAPNPTEPAAFSTPNETTLPSPYRQPPMGSHRWTTTAIIAVIEEWADDGGDMRVTTYREWKGGRTAPTDATIARLFGSWRAMIRAAGLTPAGRAAHAEPHRNPSH